MNIKIIRTVTLFLFAFLFSLGFYIMNNNLGAGLTAFGLFGILYTTIILLHEEETKRRQ